MANLYKTTRVKDKGITTEQGKFASDIKSNGDRTTNASGYVILSDDEHIFLPDTYTDRQAIIDATIGLCDALVTEPIGTTPTTANPLTPLVLTNSYKNAINQIKTNLQTLKDNLE